MPTLKRRTETNTHRQGKNNRAFYQSSRWHEYSRQYRKKHRLCVMCLEKGKTVLSECVDHIIPITNGGDMWDSINHQALCKSCHSIKTKEEKKRQIK